MHTVQSVDVSNSPKVCLQARGLIYTANLVMLATTVLTKTL